MFQAFEPQEARFVQQRAAVSAADALSINFGPPPVNRIWTIQAAAMVPSAAETRTLVWNLVGDLASAIEYAISIPQSIALTTTRGFPLLTNGMPFVLLPGQYLQCRRDAATAGSTMTIYAVIIESDMPLYEYTEPQEKRRLRRGAQELVKSVGRGTGFGGGGRGFGFIPPGSGGGGAPAA